MEAAAITAIGSAVAAGISGVTSAAGGAKSRSNARLMQNRQMAYQDKVNALNRSWSVEDRNFAANFNRENWRMQNEYNSPLNQKRLYEEAGYKYVPGGESQAGQIADVNPNTPTAQAADLSAYGAMENEGIMQQYRAAGDTLGGMIEGGLNTFQKFKAIDLQVAQAEEARAKKQVELANSQESIQRAALLFEQTTGVSLDNMIKQATTPEQIGTIKQNYENMKAAYGKIYADSQMASMYLEEVGPAFMRYAKSHWDRETNRENFDNRYRAMQAYLIEQYGEKEATMMLNNMHQQYLHMVSDLKRLDYWNSDDILNLEAEYLEHNVGIMASEASMARDRANAKVAVKDKNGKWITKSATTAAYQEQAIGLALQNQGQLLANNAQNMQNIITANTMQGTINHMNLDNNAINMTMDNFTKYTSRLLGAGLIGRFMYKNAYQQPSNIVTQSTNPSFNNMVNATRVDKIQQGEYNNWLSGKMPF